MAYPITIWGNLGNSALPKVFEIIDGELYFFDNINKHEGRFCKINKTIHVILDMDVPLGIITKDNMYSIDMGKNTIIKEFDLAGNFKREFLLYGTFYDLVRDDSGNYIFLGLVDKKSYVVIYNIKGVEINSFELLNVVLGCGLYTERNLLYIGGVDVSEEIKLFQINYLGIVVNQWTVYFPCESKIIEKILSFGIYVVILFKGETNNIVILNNINGKKIEISPQEIGLGEFVDVNIYKDQLYILDNKDIYIVPMDNILYQTLPKKIVGKRIFANGYSYIYMMYSLEFYESFRLVVKLAIVIDVIFYTIAFLSKNHAFEIDTRIIILGISLCYLVPFLITIIFTVKQLSIKEKRIERLLEINDSDNLKWAVGQILIVLLIIYIITLIFSFSFVCIIVFFIFLVILSIFIGSIFANNVTLLNKNMVVELLFEENVEIIKYIKLIISKMKENNVDEICINIFTESKFFKNIVENWCNSRRNILIQDVLVEICDKKIITVINLSKRDIRYSKLSILMDYICYVKSKIDINKIELRYYDLKNEP